MKTSYSVIALSAILATCRSPLAFAFFSPTTALSQSSRVTTYGPTAEVSRPRPLIEGRASASRGDVRQAAVRDDCKSCMEKELLAEEEAAGKGLGGANKGDRRASFEEANRLEKSRNTKIALGSFLSAVGLFFSQHSAIAPAEANPVVLLRAMETGSTPLATALTNGKPTIVDFYADWCENCKVMAPTMSEVEEQFKNQINFVVVDGNAAKNYDLVDAFRVDGIPHLAMVNAKGDVETAIIGTVPKEVVVDDIKALLNDRPLPYTGFDMFEGENHNIKGQIEIDG